MARVRQNFQGGAITDAPLLVGATTMNSPLFAGLNTIVLGTDYEMVVLNPNAVNGNPEVVKVTAHANGATSCTIVRGQDGTTPVQHATGEQWIIAPLAADFDGRLKVATSGAHTATPDIGVAELDTDINRVMTWNGTVWVPTGNPNMLGISTVGLNGTPPTLPGGVLYMQAGSSVLTTTSNGNITVTWPVVFPNGILTYFGVNGDNSVGSFNVVCTANSSIITPISGVFTCFNIVTGVALNAVQVRVNWMAIGF